jgi:hypothetical protein
MLAVEPVRAALQAGASFRARVVCNEVPQLPPLSRLLYLRFRVPGLPRLKLSALAGLRRECFGERPHYVYCDTGAAVHEHLTRERGLAFADLGEDLRPPAVRHSHGVARRKLSRRMRNAADVDVTRREALDRIESVYGVAVPELRAAGA